MPARPNNASKVTCSKCGAVDTYGKMFKRLEDKAVEDVKRKLGKIFK
ncbi:ECs_2282 family putative zinc-binding protein [Pseudomonas sp. BIC9C]